MNTETSVIKESWFELLAYRKRELLRSIGSGSGSTRLIAVFGGSAFQRKSRVWKYAFQVGSELAKRNAIVINGGYGGVMEASAAGARECDGHAIGVTCKNLPESSPNKYIDNEWKVERWDQRLVVLVWLSDGYIVMPGSSGTLVELSMLIETQMKEFIPMRPIACFSRHWRPIVKRVLDNPAMIHFTDDVSECVDIVMS